MHFSDDELAMIAILLDEEEEKTVSREPMKFWLGKNVKLRVNSLLCTKN